MAGHVRSGFIHDWPGSESEALVTVRTSAQAHGPLLVRERYPQEQECTLAADRWDAGTTGSVGQVGDHI